MSYDDLKPLYPYAGGKARSIKHISKYFKYSDTYIEPFFGGGAVFCHMYNLGLSKKFVINDIREDLMGVYREIKRDYRELFLSASKLIDSYNKLPSVGAKEMMFYEVKDDNNIKYNAASSLFLSLCDFGGVPKTDENGKYGGTSGHSLFKERQLSISIEQISLWSDALSKTTICSGDFQKVPINNENALIFCDPPYHASKVCYGEFTKNDQLRCLKWCADAAKNRNVCVMLSNRDHDGFFSSRCGPEVKIENFEMAYSAGVNSRGIETIMVWNNK